MPSDRDRKRPAVSREAKPAARRSRLLGHRCYADRRICDCARAEIARLQAELAKLIGDAARQPGAGTTHWPGCWADDPRKHGTCAQYEVKRLRSQLEAVRLFVPAVDLDRIERAAREQAGQER